MPIPAGRRTSAQLLRILEGDSVMGFNRVLVSSKPAGADALTSDMVGIA